ncbi:hypothetical protein KL924_005198 [Ogataea haglerorum]|nr:hypothetical protein KL924_005198 [Ogataea haglerorum]
MAKVILSRPSGFQYPDIDKVVKIASGSTMFARAFQSSLRTPKFRLAPPAVRFLSQETRSAIEQAISSAPVVLFMKGTPQAPACGFSRATIQILGQLGVDPHKFAAYNVLEDPELRQGIKEYSEWPTIPQLYVNKDFVGGCDIVMAMSQSGELSELLESADALVPEEEEDK